MEMLGCTIFKRQDQRARRPYAEAKRARMVCTRGNVDAEKRKAIAREINDAARDGAGVQERAVSNEEVGDLESLRAGGYGVWRAKQTDFLAPLRTGPSWLPPIRLAAVRLGDPIPNAETDTTQHDTSSQHDTR